VTAHAITDVVSIDNFPMLSGALLVTGSVAVVGMQISASIGGSVSVVNFPPIQQVWTEGPFGVTGSISVYTSGPQAVSGTVTVINPATVGVSGSVALTNWPAVIGVSSSSPSGFWSAGPSGVTGSVALTNWPAVIGVSSSSPSGFWFAGTAGVSGTVNVTVTSSTGLMVGNSPALPLFVSVTSSLPVSVTFPAVQTVTGSVNLLGLQANGNSTTTPLGANASFTGSWDLVRDYAYIAQSVFTDQQSANLGMQLQWSGDGVNVDRTETTNVGPTGLAGRVFAHTIRGRFFRTVYTNGTVPQGVFRLTTDYHQDGVGLLTHALTDKLNIDQFALLTRTVLYGQSTGLTGSAFNEVNVSPQGNMQTVLSALVGSGSGGQQLLQSTGAGDLKVSIGGPNQSAFGDAIVCNPTPLFQFDFSAQLVQAGLFNQVGGPFTGSTGVADNSSNRLRLQTGTGAAGAAVFISNAIAKYRAGEGITTRFTVVFGTGVSGSNQFVGMCAPTITWTNNVTAPQPPITAVDIGDGYFFGFSGTAFGVRHKNSMTGLDTFVSQSAWNGDTCDGSGNNANPTGFFLNPTFGNVYMVRYPYLGFGNIKFYVQQTGDDRSWVLVHTIAYGNNVTQVQVGNPNLNFFAQAINVGSTTNTTMLVASVGSFIDGPRTFTGPAFCVQGRLANNTNNVELPVVSIRNVNVLNGNVNRGVIRLRSLSFSGDGANVDSTLLLRRNAPLTNANFLPLLGSPVASSQGYKVTGAQSITTFDTAATAVSGTLDTVVFNATAARNTGYQVDMTPYDIFIVPGDTITATMRSFANNNSVQVALNFNEDL
jgi:hypothetical protein